MSIPAEQDILGLEVSVDHVHVVQVLQRHGHLDHIEPYPVLWDALELAHKGEEVSSLRCSVWVGGIEWVGNEWVVGNGFVVGNEW